MTSSYRGGDRVFRVALGASLALHLILGFVFFSFVPSAQRANARHAVRKPDETVTISSAFHFEKRVRAAAGGGGRPRVVAARSPVAARARVPANDARQPAAPRKPVGATPRPARRELAKLAPTAPPAAKERARAATASPATAEPAPREAASSSKARLTAAQIARIQQNLAATIATARARENPLGNASRKQIPASTRRYAIDFSGATGTLRGAQGVCYPTKEWEADGYDYYYETCRAQHPDGSVRSEPVPWPQRFLAASDPLRVEQPPGTEVPLQLPPRGWKPDPAEPLDPDLADYLRENGFRF